MKRILILVIIVGVLIGFSILPACAGLVPMSWGMPIVKQSASLTAFQKDTAAATDNAAAAVAFPDSIGLGGSVFGSAFPTITQSSAQSQLLNSVRFQNENQDFLYAYPYFSLGGSPVPGMGFF